MNFDLLPNKKLKLKLVKLGSQPNGLVKGELLGGSGTYSKFQDLKPSLAGIEW